MYIAKDENNNNVSITDAKRKGLYFCPTCGAPLIVRAENSTQKSKHFAHQRGTYCTDDWKYEMSEWHKAWQEKFPIECREVVIESEGEKHRADVCVDNIVVEFQHSPISYEDFTKRNKFYLKCGKRIIWIFDAKEKIKDPIEKIISNPPSEGKENRAFKWKRCQNQFANFYDTYSNNSPIEIHLETKMEGNEEPVLLQLSKVDAKAPEIVLAKDLITQKDLLTYIFLLKLLVSQEKYNCAVQQQKQSQYIRVQPAQRYTPNGAAWLENMMNSRFNQKHTQTSYNRKPYNGKSYNRKKYK